MPCWQVRDHTNGNLKTQPRGNKGKAGGSKGRQIKLDGLVFLNPSICDATSSQQVYVTPQVTFLFLSQKELCPVHPDFPVQATETIQNQRTAVDSDNDNCQDNCLTEPETHNLAKKNMHKQPRTGMNNC